MELYVVFLVIGNTIHVFVLIDVDLVVVDLFVDRWVFSECSSILIIVIVIRVIIFLCFLNITDVDVSVDIVNFIGRYAVVISEMVADFSGNPLLPIIRILVNGDCVQLLHIPRFD